VKTSLRTHTCGELRAADVGKKVKLCGWVASVRDHGGVVFADVRDRYGRTQIVFRPERGDLAARASALRSEYAIGVEGVVGARPAEAANRELPTGEIEVLAEALETFNAARVPPFEVSDRCEAALEVRLRYRHLDLRRPSLQRNLILRSRFLLAVRNAFAALGFAEIETPILTKATPEGARDFLVPSRVTPGAFYALPQSPQLFKQILMMAGFDRYVQVARCFRDEDLRADRQPEFTQIDLEMAFVREDDLREAIETALAAGFREAFGARISTPFPRMKHEEALGTYGVDKPDLRYGLPLVDVGEEAGEGSFRAFREALDAGGKVLAVRVPGASGWTRRQTDELGARAVELGAKGLAPLKTEEGDLSGSISKFFEPGLRRRIRERLEARAGDLLLFVAGPTAVARRALGTLRTEIADRLHLAPAGELRFCWVTDFPLFEWSEEEGRWQSANHPFTAPADESLSGIDRDPGSLRSRGFDLVLNGVELGSGGIRIHHPDLQGKIFSFLGIGPQEARDRFGFLLDALSDGAPPHGGFAIGVDRVVQVALGLEGIREAIAFPKTASGACIFTGAPSTVPAGQLADLHIQPAPPASRS
jgi:aspartyl-tRNA synthetase